MADTYNGADWATHTVDLLLSNTYNLYGGARYLSLEDPSGDLLKDWLDRWFWADLSDYDRSDRYAIEATRDGISRSDYDEIDWAYIADSLAAD